MPIGDDIIGTSVIGTFAANIALPRRLVLSAGNTLLVTPEVVIPALSKEIVVRIKRPTTLAPLAWGSADRIKISVVVSMNGLEYRYSGGADGGIRVSENFGLSAPYEIPEYILRCSLPVGYFGMRTGVPKRLGETATTPITARIEIQRDGGTCDTMIEAACFTAPAPIWTFKNSVAFDNANGASDVTGTGTLDFTFTSSGTNRGIFAAVANSNTGAATPTSTSVTYDQGGSNLALTEQWDVLGTTQAIRNAGYTGIGQATGAVTVRSVLSGDPIEHSLICVSLTGVNQSAPVGTAVNAQVASGTITTTVTGLNTDGLICDHLYEVAIASERAVTGGQTERWDELQMSGATNAQVSTKSGNSDGVMSWATGVNSAVLGAIEFKPASHYPALERFRPRGLTRGLST